MRHRIVSSPCIVALARRRTTKHLQSWFAGDLTHTMQQANSSSGTLRSSIGTGFMKLLAETADLAEMVSAFVTKGGWITAPLGGALLLYLMQDRLVFNPVRTAPTLFRSGTTHRARAVSISMSDGIRLQGWWLRPNGPCD